jgi:hypothetical protein
MRNISDKSCGGNQDTFYVRSLFFAENLAFYETTWKNIVEPDRPQMTIRRTRIACWITKVTNTDSEFEILIAIPQQ